MIKTGQISLKDCFYCPSYSIILVLRLGIWWRDEIWIFKILNLDFLEKEKSFLSEIKDIFFSFTSVLF